jgi:predicted phage baseplate assembly protein
MSCDCDKSACAPALALAAGLAELPRAPGLFPDWRRSLLAAVGRQPELAQWRAREAGDLGLMLIESAAYVFDVCSFYDQRTANESYLGTARYSGAQRQLVSLLGYRPRPAMGASVWLAAQADGTRVLRVPAGTAFRSGAFGAEAPQRFELGADTDVDPRINQLEVARVRATLLDSPLSHVLARTASLRVAVGTPLLFDIGGSLLAARVASVAPEALRLRDAISRVTLATALTPPASAACASTRVLKPGASAGAWKLGPASGEAAVASGHELSLESRLPLRVGEAVLVESGSTLVARRITAVAETLYTVMAPLTSTLTDADDNISHLVSPAIRLGVTRITLDQALPAGASAANLVLHHAMVEAFRLHAPLKDTLAQGDAMALPGLIDAPRVAAGTWLLQDVHGEGALAGGTLDAAARSASADSTPPWGATLWAPVKLHGNALFATRGETVRDERLGAGDAAQAFQTLRLKKKPLTYLAAANASGRVSTLALRVGGVLWTEVESFYGCSDADTVYTVHHDEAGETDIVLGGGARAPTGAMITASYRFGAGAAVPPADAVKQLAQPLAGLRQVRNVLPAFGGADAEGADELRARAPASALLLGRAISLADLEVAAAQQAGVRAARAAWRWDALGLRPAAVLTLIGDAQLLAPVLSALRALAEPDAPISVALATPQAARLDVDIGTDPLLDPAAVQQAVMTALFAPVGLPGTGGLLRPERLGPDGVLFQSHVVRSLMQVPGVTELRSLGMDGSAFSDVARQPAAGSYFDFEASGVWVNGAKAP